MIKFLSKLVVRIFPPKFTLAEEMDECLEILFVERGLYKVGYEINNQLFFRRHLGMFTNIGGFQVSYDMRFNYFYKAITEIKCLAISKINYKSVFDEFSDFKCQIKNKFWCHYSQQVYQPLQKAKNQDLLDFNYRDDFR